MGNQLNSAYDKLMNIQDKKILLLGFDNAGKTTILKYCQGLSNMDIGPTIGYNIETVQQGKVRLHIMDVCGGKQQREQWRRLIPIFDGVIFVFDASDTYRINEVQKEIELIKGKPLLIFANKIDKSAVEPQLNHFPTCGITGEGIQEGLNWFVQRLIN